MDAEIQENFHPISISYQKDCPYQLRPSINFLSNPLKKLNLIIEPLNLFCRILPLETICKDDDEMNVFEIEGKCKLIVAIDFLKIVESLS